jgi:hypothetical protein
LLIYKFKEITNPKTNKIEIIKDFNSPIERLMEFCKKETNPDFTEYEYKLNV